MAGGPWFIGLPEEAVFLKPVNGTARVPFCTLRWIWTTTVCLSLLRRRNSKRCSSCGPDFDDSVTESGSNTVFGNSRMKSSSVSGFWLVTASWSPPNPLRPRAFGGKGAEGMKKEIPSNRGDEKGNP